jgi:peptidoglycan/xylan/chitin deacetylase (PgdA/CDA1 family)
VISREPIVFRTVLKTATASAATWTGLNEWIRASESLPSIVCYHRVVERLDMGDGLALPAMEISVAMLEQHLDWLGRHSRIISLDELGAKLEDAPGARPLAAVTFDDGYSDIYHHAFPLLKRKGIPAGIFVVTDLLGSTQLPLHERLHALLVGASRQWKSAPDDLRNMLEDAHVERSVREHARRVARDPFSTTRFLLEHLSQADVQRVIDRLEIDNDIGESWRLALQPLSWEMLAEMRDAGMTIGSHSKSHPFMTNENVERVLEEADSSRGELERRLGVEAACFAYPGGSFNPTVVQAVATAGYRYAFTICRHRDPQHPLLTVPRTALWERSCLDPFGRFSPAIMGCQVAGTFNWISRCKQNHAERRASAERGLKQVACRRSGSDRPALLSSD